LIDEAEHGPMRVLITLQPAHGHLHNLVPLARALDAAGHEVVFASSPSFQAAIEAVGFRAFPAGFDWLESEIDRFFPQIRAYPPGSDQAAWFVMNLFAGPLAQRMAEDVLTLSRHWLPDVIVRDPNEYGGCVAAEALGIPHATSSKGLFPDPAMTRRLIGGSLAKVRQAHGLPPDPDLTMLSRWLDLAFVPPGFLDEIDVVAPTTLFLRPVSFNASRDATRPDWLHELPPRPTIHATFGTVFNRTTEALTALRAVFDGLRDDPVNLIVTTGRDVDLTAIEPPPNARIESYLPHHLLLPHCDLVICHGGFNTVMAALNQGIPVVAVPLGADQFRNAARLNAHGLGLALEPAQRTAAAMRAAVRTVLDDPGYRERARALRDQIAVLPGPARGVELLEQLVLERSTAREKIA
jgi:UDP:flavonoid glycosyltransferase YjiC (YdhE family)